MNPGRFVILEYDDNRWMEFISSHPESCLVHHPGWVGRVAHSYEYHPNGYKYSLTPIMKSVINYSPKLVCRLTGQLFYRFLVERKPGEYI